MEEFLEKRLPEREKSAEYMEKVRRREVPATSDAIKWMFFQEGSWPYMGADGKNGNPFTTSPEVNELNRPLLRRLVENLRKNSTDMPFEPSVHNGYESYVNPKRFQAELQHLFRENVLLAALAGDVRKPNDYRRWEVVGKSVLLVRDAGGKFRAFENCCRHCGMELVSKDQPYGNQKLFVSPSGVSYATNGELMNVPVGEEGFANSDAMDVEKRNLIELSAREKAGLLFVIPTALDPAEAEKRFREAMPETLMRELSLYHLGSHHRVVEQSIVVDANWKLANDTFDEIYHLQALHPLLREQNVSNCSVFRSFPTEVDGPPQPLHSDMLVGRFTTRIMAAGDVEESRWEEPSVLDHCNHVYNIAPNTVFFVQASNIIMSQQWPGDHAGQSIVEVSLFNPNPPESAKELVGSRKQFSFMLDVVATEDFPCLPKMQANFANNRHAELVFGRNEPALTDRHRYFDRMVRGKF